MRRNFVDTSNSPPSAFPKMPPYGSSMALSPWGSAPNCWDRAADDSESADTDQVRGFPTRRDGGAVQHN